MYEVKLSEAWKRRHKFTLFSSNFCKIIINNAYRKK